jgi:hypothetical protein
MDGGEVSEEYGPVNARVSWGECSECTPGIGQAVCSNERLSRSRDISMGYVKRRCARVNKGDVSQRPLWIPFGL